MTQQDTQIRLLGALEIQRANELVNGFESTKAQALLAYLVLQQQPIPRTTLVGLFWPDKSEQRGRNNLSVVVHNLSNLLPGAIQANRQQVGFACPPNCWVDAHKVAQLLALGEPPALDAAVPLYRGELLAGLHLDGCPEFETWLATERETWRQRIAVALGQLGDYCLETQEYERGRTYAARLLDLDPWNEHAHRQMMQLLAASGQRSTAIAQYERCRRLLAEELGIEPEAATTALYQQIAGDESPPAAGTPSARRVLRHNLPAQLTSFLGRDAELNHLSTLLRNPTCRLITLVGMGGVGKTRLGIQAARREVASFRDGVWLLSLVGLGAVKHLPAALAEALHIPIRQQADYTAQVLAYLRERQLLLLLDNCEHLLPELTPLIDDVLAIAPSVTILCTSRERLRLTAEWVVEVSGLAVPTDTAAQPAAETGAVQLFVERAQQVNGMLQHTTAEHAAIIRLCQLVGGVPLAIELAAALTRILSCEEIAAELAHSLEVLTASVQPHDPRHQSMRAVFDHSWRLLASGEQEVLERLAVFRGTFERQAAEQVAHATLPILTALLDKSLLQRTDDNRFRMHELLRQYATERLRQRPIEQTETLNRHAAYYAGFLAARQPFLFTPHEKQAIDEVATEIENVRLAWQWLVAHVPAASLDQVVRVLAYLYYVRDWLQEGVDALATAAHMLQTTLPAEATPPLPAHTTLGKVLTYQGLLLVMRGDYLAARECLQRVEHYIHEPAAWWEQGLAYNFLAMAAYRMGNHDEVLTYAQHALDIATKIQDVWTRGFAQTFMGYGGKARGRYDEALRAFEQALADFRLIGDQRSISLWTCELGDVYCRMAQFDRARAALSEARTLSGRLNHQAGLVLALDNLGRVELLSGNPAQALELFRESLALAQQIGDQWDIARIESYLGMTLQALGQLAPAHQHVSSAVARAQRIGACSVLMLAQGALADVLAAQGNTDEALRLLEVVLHDAASEQIVLVRARQVLARLAGEG